jgi:penicillin-binding protein 1B
LAHRLKKWFPVLKKSIVGLLVVSCAIVLVWTGMVVWAFQVKLQRWPIFVFCAPFNLRVGDDIEKVRLMERLTRLGYEKTSDMIPGPGQVTTRASETRIFCKASPIAGQGIVSGPIRIYLDWNRVLGIRLVRSDEEVDHVTLEPELLDIIPAEGSPPELCRPLRLDAMNPLLVDAVILAEDARFFSHHGIDPVSIRLALKTNLRARRYVQGGSTIPQQLIKTTILSSQRTLWRKFNEIFLAIIADAIYSKKRILEAYLNRIYFGHWGAFPIKGVAEASRLLFGKRPIELEPSECALLAAAIVAPNRINPNRNPERALARRNMVLGLLLKAGKISREVHDHAIESPVKMNRPGAPPVKAGAFVRMVLQRLKQHQFEGTESRTRSGVMTSLNPIIQKDAIAGLKKLGAVDGRAHLILARPLTGVIFAFIAPEKSHWQGSRGNLETLAPLLCIPALTPGQRNQVRFTLASPIFFPGNKSGSVTFREAFREHRPMLVRKLVTSIGLEEVISVLKEFDAPARLNANRRIVVAPMTPTQMAQTYFRMATLGSAAELNPGIRTARGGHRQNSVERKAVSFDPAVLFLVNHVLKGLDRAYTAGARQSRNWTRPSLFVAKDKAGLWAIAYRLDLLLLIRIAGSDFNYDKVTKIMTDLLPKPQFAAHSRFPPPTGIVYRTICVKSGQRATSLCPQVTAEPFLKGTQPTEWCSLPHRTAPGKK